MMITELLQKMQKGRKMSNVYEERVSNIITINELFSLNEQDVREIIASTKSVIFDAHFILMSGYHSREFLMFSRIARHPQLLSKISREMVGWIENSQMVDIDVVLSTSRAGMLMAYDVARELNITNGNSMPTRAAYAACDLKGNVTMRLLEGSDIRRKDKVLVVNDVCSTGHGVETLVNLAESYNGTVVGICVFANRAIDTVKIERLKKAYKFHSIVELKMPAWKKREAPVDLLAMKPEIYSREINSLTGEKSYEELFESESTAA